MGTAGKFSEVSATVGLILLPLMCLAFDCRRQSGGIDDKAVMADVESARLKHYCLEMSADSFWPYSELCGVEDACSQDAEDVDCLEYMDVENREACEDFATKLKASDCRVTNAEVLSCIGSVSGDAFPYVPGSCSCETCCERPELLPFDEKEFRDEVERDGICAFQFRRRGPECLFLQEFLLNWAVRNVVAARENWQRLRTNHCGS